MTDKKPRLVLIGNGMAGVRTLEELLKLAPDYYQITVFGAEPYGSYNRILLSPYLAGEADLSQVLTHDRDWYRERRITLHTGNPVVRIDRGRRRVIAADGSEAGYERLLLATGSTPIKLPVPGANLEGVMTFRDLDDVHHMLHCAHSQQRRAVVIGGGLLGLEAAHGLLKQGLDVTVVHRSDTLMERQLDTVAGSLLQESLQQRGLRFRLSADTTAILGSQKVTGVGFADGSEIPADLVVMAAGVRPNMELAKTARLPCERGVLVDDTLQTFDPRIYAVGECVQHRGATYGLVAPLWRQAQVCANHLAESGVSRYRSCVIATQLKVNGIDLFSAGDLGNDTDCEVLVFQDPSRSIYRKLVIRDNRLQGTVLYGDTQDGPWYYQLMCDCVDITPLREQLVFGRAYLEEAA